MTFRPLRRTKNAISDEAAKQLLRISRRGVLAMHGDNGYPYAIPVNYVYLEEEGTIVFHSAKAGHKVDSLSKDARVCFTVYGNEMPGDAPWSPRLQSTVVFGQCHPADHTRSIPLLRKLAGKYYPDAETVEAEITKSAKAAQVYVITIEHLSGKQVQER